MFALLTLRLKHGNYVSEKSVQPEFDLPIILISHKSQQHSQKVDQLAKYSPKNPRENFYIYFDFQENNLLILKLR